MVPSTKFTLAGWTAIICIGLLATVARHNGSTAHANTLCPKKSEAFKKNAAVKGPRSLVITGKPPDGNKAYMVPMPK